jgi:hypothetical protein
MKAIGILLGALGLAAIIGVVVILWMVGAGAIVFADPGAALGAGFLTAILGIVSTAAGVGILADW